MLHCGSIYYSKNAISFIYLLVSIILSSTSLASPPPLNCSWWQHHILNDNLIHFLNATQTPNSGFFRVDLNREWEWVPPTIPLTSIVSQARLVFVFSTAAILPFTPPNLKKTFTAQAKAGARFLMKNLKDEEYGGFFWSVTENGTVMDDHKSTYGHVFAMFGLANLYALTNDSHWLNASLDTWTLIKERMRDNAAYDCSKLQHHFNFTSDCLTFYQSLPRDFSVPTETVRSQDPMMHVYEALVTLYELTQDENLKKDAMTFVEFVTSVLYQRPGSTTTNGTLSHFIPALYDTTYLPLPHTQGGKLPVGHQMEWAYWLSRGVISGVLEPTERWNTIAWQLLDGGLEAGYDYKNGGLYYWTDYDGIAIPNGDDRSSPQSKDWWTQNELLRALMHFGALADETSPIPASQLWSLFNQSFTLVSEKLIDPNYGGWYRVYDPLSITQNYNKADIWKICYHVTGMSVEALKLCH